MQFLFTVPLFPLLGAIVNGAFGARTPKKFVSIAALLGSGLAFISAVYAFFGLLTLPPESRSFQQPLFLWIQSGSLRIEMGLQLDALSGLMMLIVTGVGFLIHLYSTAYMHEEPGYWRYFSYLNLFLFSMLILVLGNGFLVMFIGWEGVGLCSYLLIGYYYEKKSAGDAGKKAFIMNRIGDFGFILGMLLILSFSGSLNYQDVFTAASEKLEYNGVTVTMITLFLFLGATGKSAQIPLYTWLPDAMEGPTPVSALIHAATMVTAGIYMMARSSVLFALAPSSLLVAAVIGAATAIFAATIALVQNDIKKVLAYSTVSQLGYMFLASGVGAFAGAIFHVMTHAFFKACLFLGSGSVIHALHSAKDPQDMRQMGGLRAKMPLTYWTFLVSTLAIAGIFPFSGFFSKDDILFETFAGGHSILWGVGACAALLTAFYMSRLLLLTFHGKFRGEHHVEHHIHESPWAMTLPLVLLAILAAIAGAIGLPAVMGKSIVKEFLAPVFEGAEAVKAAHSAEEASHESLEWILMGVSFAIALTGMAAAWILYPASSIPDRLEKVFRPLHRLLFRKYFVDEIYDAIIVRPLKLLSEKFLWAVVDVLWIDGLVNAAASAASFAGAKARLIQTGSVRNYALVMLLGAIVILLFNILK